MVKTLKILPVLAVGIPLLLILGMMLFIGMMGFWHCISLRLITIKGDLPPN